MVLLLRLPLRNRPKPAVQQGRTDESTKALHYSCYTAILLHITAPLTTHMRASSTAGSVMPAAEWFKAQTK
jgi:hypothetical protein